MNYHITFRGREQGSVGMYYTKTVIMEAPTTRDAINRLFKNWECQKLFSVLSVIPATKGCEGCIFHRAQAGEKERRWCINGGYFTPRKCKKDNTIFIKRKVNHEQRNV